MSKNRKPAAALLSTADLVASTSRPRKAVGSEIVEAPRPRKAVGSEIVEDPRPRKAKPSAPALVTPTNRAWAFLAHVAGVTAPVGRKQAEAEGVPTTAAAAIATINGGISPVPESALETAKAVVSAMMALEPASEFEAGVRAATLDIIAAGDIIPAAAPYAAWCGKVVADAAARQAAQGNALPTGKGTYDARFVGVRQVTTRFGLSFVHTFRTKCGKLMEWWTSRPHAINAPDCFRVECTIKRASFDARQGEMVNSISHVKTTKIASF